MPRKTKKRVVKSKRSKVSKASKKAKTSKAKTSRPRKAKARAKPSPRKAPAAAAARDAERKRLLSLERALERDVDNEEEPNALKDSAEYIPGVADDDLAEELGEAAVATATSGDQAAENIRDEDLSEEEGGPFVPSTGRREFASGTDESNPEDAEPADFPTATSRK